MDEKTEKRNNQRLASLDRQVQLRRDAFVKAAVTTKEGREYLYWLLELSRVGRNPYSGNALSTAFACGELNVGQQIQAHIIDVAPNAFLQMLAEKEEERLNAIRPESSPGTQSGEYTPGSESDTD
jgi:hypothetical protein